MRTPGAQGFRSDGRIRGMGRPQGQYSFDIADAFQMGKYILAGLVALIVIVFIVRAVYFATPATYQVAGQEVSLARGTTYRGLVDSGALDVHKGNLVAVDDEVLQEGGGKDPTVFLNGEPVNLDDRISDQGDITAENGEDEIEPYTATQEITPIETQIARDKQSEEEGAEAGKFNFYNGVLHVITDPGQEGIVETRTGETTGKTATVKVQDMKPRVFENLHPVLPESKKYIALTFDDGPTPSEDATLGVLDVLAKYNVKGTFFMLGTAAEENPDTARQVAQAGHQVLSHSYSHDEEHFLNNTTEDDVRTQVGKAREAIGAATGTEPLYIRPPGGNVDVKAIKAAGTLADGYIGWSVDTFDYNLPGSDAIASVLVNDVEPGSVVLMHDGGGDRSQTIEGLDKAIPELQAKGYTFVTIDEMVKAVLEANGRSTDGISGNTAATAETQQAAAATGASESSSSQDDAAAETGSDEESEGDATE